MLFQNSNSRRTSRSGSPSVITFRLAGLGRFLLLVPVLLAIAGGWFVTRWYIGSTVSEVVTRGETPNLEMARVAARWAPADPFVHWRLGVLLQRQFSPASLNEAVREFEIAVQLAPNDFRYWDELGRALEAVDDSDAAERAFRRAVELAPSYYYPRWHLGNFLVRKRNREAAFQELVRAATANERLWPQVLNLAWQAYDGDVDRIAIEACREPRVRIMFSEYLIGVNRPEDALRLWKTMSPDERRQVIDGARKLRKTFADAKRFHAALEVHRDSEVSLNSLPVAESFSNGGFEEGITLPVSKPFSWTIGSNVQTQISISDAPHRGLRSLQIVISATNQLDRINASQTIVVEPNTQYHFECYARTEELTSASTPVVIILDAATGESLANSTPLPTGTNDWQRIALDFKTKNSDGVIVMIGRLTCTVGEVCPIFGTVWYDDFNLQRGSSGGAPRPIATTSREGNRAASGKA